MGTTQLHPESATELHPRYALHAGMLEGWERRLRAAGNSEDWVKDELAHVNRFVTFTGQHYAWEWSASDVDRWGAELAATKAPATTRYYQGSLRRYLSFLTDPAYEWNDRCQELYGRRLVQLCTPENTLIHTWRRETRKRRRPYSDQELDLLFSGLQSKMHAAEGSKRKGLLTAARDYALYATTLGYGLRAREVALLETFDIRPAADPVMRERFGDYGTLHVRFGKAVHRGAPRERHVPSIPEFRFAVEALQWYVEEIRPYLALPNSTALFVSERGNVLDSTYVSSHFARLREVFGIPKELTLHCLRHTFATRLGEFNYPELFISTVLGHEDSATLLDYTDVSDDFKNRIIREAMTQIGAA